MRKRDGSIFSFIAIAVVLIIATGLVVFAINNRTSSEGSIVDEVISQVDEEQENSQDENQGSEGGESTEGTTDSSEASEDEVRSGDDQPVADEESSDVSSDAPVEDSLPEGGVIPSPEPESPAPQQPSAPAAPDTTASINASELPETGLTQDLLSSAIGILAIVGGGYIYYHFGRNQ